MTLIDFKFNKSIRFFLFFKVWETIMIKKIVQNEKKIFLEIFQEVWIAKKITSFLWKLPSKNL